MKIGDALIALVRRNDVGLVELQQTLMKICNDYHPALTFEGLDSPEDLDLDEMLRYAFDQWVSGVGYERKHNSAERHHPESIIASDQAPCAFCKLQACGACATCNRPVCQHGALS